MHSAVSIITWPVAAVINQTDKPEKTESYWLKTQETERNGLLSPINLLVVHAIVLDYFEYNEEKNVSVCIISDDDGLEM